MILTTIFGVIGSITAFITFVSSGREVYKIREGSSMEQFSSIQLHAAFISSALWVMYGFIHGDIFLVIIHCMGFLMAMSDLTMFVRFSQSFGQMMKHHGIFVAELFSIGLLGRLARSFADPGNFAGVICAYGSLMMRAVKLGYDAERTERVPVFVCLGLFANGVIWSVYGVMSSDMFIWVPHLVGALVDLVQLVQHAIHYYKNSSPERQIAEETQVLN